MCIACKLMECVIVNSTLNFMRANKVITKRQHGFMSGVARQPVISSNWTRSIHNNKNCGFNLYRLQASIDTLILKLQSYGISGQLLNWIESFFGE